MTRKKLKNSPPKTIGRPTLGDALVKRLKEDLETDLALCIPQIIRRYPTPKTPQDIKNALVGEFNVIEIPIQPSRESNPIPMTFVMPRNKNYSSKTLRHLAGMAEMRWQLHAFKQEWKVLPAFRADWEFPDHRPDAYWENKKGTIAIEWDAGRHDQNELKSKAIAFQEYYDAQIWGCATKMRTNNLIRVFKQNKINVKVIYAPWHEGKITTI
jgi:hypothetical protein